MTDSRRVAHPAPRGLPDAGALPKAANIRSSIAWHSKGIGYHKQAGPSTKVAWENLRQAWSMVSKQACGAVLIDGTAVYLCKHDETAVPA